MDISDLFGWFITFCAIAAVLLAPVALGIYIFRAIRRERAVKRSMQRHPTSTQKWVD